MSAIDVNFDFQAEAGLTSSGEERDSDRHSPTLQEYHRALWSKPLPNGKNFELVKIKNNQLYHKSEMGEFYLSSDWGAVTLSGRKAVKKIIHEIDFDSIETFRRQVVTIGARIIWPANRINGMSTINGAKGMNYFVADRLDLTVECIRRYYQDEMSPLYETLMRYNDFFKLFDDFKGYVDFFLLQDYVSEDYTSVNISEPFDGFHLSPIPKTANKYHLYMEATSRLIDLRNRRITKYVENEFTG